MSSPLSQRWGSFPLCRLLMVVGVLVVQALAQCSTQWLPGDAVAGTDGVVHATTMWDSDGPGPMPPRLVVGGLFGAAGTVVAKNIAVYDPVSGGWSAVGPGLNQEVRALTTLPNGELVAGGLFSASGGGSANFIARWDGTSWSTLGSGINYRVLALTVLSNGDLVAGGELWSWGCIARWNGTSWSAMGSGMDNIVSALTTLPNGDVVAGGLFTTAGGVSANYIARWDGTSWLAVGAGVGPVGPNMSLSALTVSPNGDLVAGGRFTTAGGVSANYIARWDGTSWSPLGSGMNGPVYALTTLPNGDVVAGGAFNTAGGVSAKGIARWDGTSWSALGSAMSGGSATSVNALTTLPNGDLVAGGDFTRAGGVGANYIARWNGTSWSAASSGMTASVAALTTLANGDLVAGGPFLTAGGVSANRIASWNGVTWLALGSGMSGFSSQTGVYALTTLANGDLVAGGVFSMAGGVSANHVARWNGTSWSPLGSGMSGSSPQTGVYALTTLANGDLVAGGDFLMAGGVSANKVARWDGTSWSPLGSGPLSSGSPAWVSSLTTRPNGDLIAAGWGAFGGIYSGRVERWDGTTWSTIGATLYGSTTASIMCLTTLPNGDVVAGGFFSGVGGVSANCLARWNGNSWSALGSGVGPVHALTTLPNGDLVAGGSYWTGVSRWDGNSWSALGSANGGVRAFARLPNGDLAVGGLATIVGGAVSAYVARLTTTCPATVSSTGSGCTGSGGPNVLTATSLPWTGSTFHAVATGMPANALAVAVHGFATASIPMATILPQGVPGCALLASPDLLVLCVPAAGSVATALPIPNTVVLAGLVLHQQVVPLELDALGNITAVTSTNALTLTIGTF